MITRRATMTALAGLVSLPWPALANDRIALPRLTRRRAKAEFDRLFGLMVSGDSEALSLYGHLELVRANKMLSAEEKRAFLLELATEAKASGPRFYRINSFDRYDGNADRAVFFASLEYRSKVENYCYPQSGDGGEPEFCTNEPGYQLSIVGWYVEFDGPIIRRLRETYRIS